MNIWPAPSHKVDPFLQLTKKLWHFQGDPINIRAATKLLGHTRPWTTKRYYNHAQAIDASRRYHGRLSELRDRLGCSGNEAEDRSG